MKAVQKIKPASDDLIIRDPITKTPLSIKGEMKPFIGIDGVYWRRRLKDKSVVVVVESTNEQIKKTYKEIKKK